MVPVVPSQESQVWQRAYGGVGVSGHMNPYPRYDESGVENKLWRAHAEGMKARIKKGYGRAQQNPYEEES